MKIFIAITMLILQSISLFSQNQDYNWLMGGDQIAGINFLNFNTFPVNVSSLDWPSLEFNLTNSSFSNSEGTLLAYSNGIIISDASHLLMINGDSLNPGPIADAWYDQGYPLNQGAFFLNHPGNENLYYLFHAERNLPGGLLSSYCPVLYYSLIDKTLNDDKGGVIEKNIPLISDTLTIGKISACQHANGRDWWILMPEYDRYSYHRFLLTPDTIMHFEIQILELSQGYGAPATGQVTFSPDGTKYARHDLRGFPAGHFIRLYDFDRCSGILSNQIHLPLSDTAGVGGIAFSPDSRWLYVSSQEVVYQFDTEADDVEATKTIVAETDGFQDTLPSGDPWFPLTFYNAQLAPDGKIYISSAGSSQYLHVIHQPNKGGLACDVRQHDIHLPRWNFRSVPHFPHYRLGPLDGSPCDTLGLDNLPLADFTWEADTLQPQIIEFTDNSVYEPTEWFWEFDDGATSMEINPVHEYSEVGVYNVCLTVSNQYDADTKCREVVIDQVVATGEVAQPSIFFAVSPNPASEWLQLQWRFSSSAPAQWRLYDAFGNEVAAQKLLERQGLEVIYLENLESGVYFWEVVQGGRKVESGKVVIVE